MSMTSWWPARRKSAFWPVSRCCPRLLQLISGFYLRATTFSYPLVEEACGKGGFQNMRGREGHRRDAGSYELAIPCLHFMGQRAFLGTSYER
jgi:hypothetical protein